MRACSFAWQRLVLFFAANEGKRHGLRLSCCFFVGQKIGAGNTRTMRAGSSVAHGEATQCSEVGYCGDTGYGCLTMVSDFLARLFALCGVPSATCRPVRKTGNKKSTFRRWMEQGRCIFRTAIRAGCSCSFFPGQRSIQSCKRSQRKAIRPTSRALPKFLPMEERQGRRWRKTLKAQPTD